MEFIRAAWALCRREVLRFFRQKNRVIGAVGQPLIFWLLFGAGLNQYFRIGGGSPEGTVSADQNFQAYFFPGVLVLMVLFTAIFTTISVIEDRREGFLQSVLTAPISRGAMVLGKVLGGSAIAMVQGLIFLLAALLIEIETDAASLVALVGLLFVSAVALTSLGLVIAWRMNSTQGFHAIMTLLLMPLWLLSGAFFPPPQLTDAFGAGQASWGQIGLHYLMWCNPLTYCVAGTRRLLFSEESLAPLALPGTELCWGVSLVFAAVMFAAAWRIASKNTSGDLLV